MSNTNSSTNDQEKQLSDRLDCQLAALVQGKDLLPFLQDENSLPGNELAEATRLGNASIQWRTEGTANLMAEGHFKNLSHSTERIGKKLVLEEDKVQQQMKKEEQEKLQKKHGEKPKCLRQVAEERVTSLDRQLPSRVELRPRLKKLCLKLLHDEARQEMWAQMLESMDEEILESDRRVEECMKQVQVVQQMQEQWNVKLKVAQQTHDRCKMKLLASLEFIKKSSREIAEIERRLERACRTEANIEIAD